MQRASRAIVLARDARRQSRAAHKGRRSIFSLLEGEMYVCMYVCMHTTVRVVVLVRLQGCSRQLCCKCSKNSALYKIKSRKNCLKALRANS